MSLNIRALYQLKRPFRKPSHKIVVEPYLVPDLFSVIGSMCIEHFHHCTTGKSATCFLGRCSGVGKQLGLVLGHDTLVMVVESGGSHKAEYEENDAQSEQRPSTEKAYLAQQYSLGEHIESGTQTEKHEGYTGQR